MAKKDIVVEEIKNEPIDEAVEEIKDEPVEESIEEYTGDLRGFKSLAEAKDYPNTPEFKKLDIGCRTEYVDWLKTITKED